MNQNNNLPKLKDLLFLRWEDIHLVHDDIDMMPHTIVELDDSTLTDAGKQAWLDVLNATVKRVYTGLYGAQIELCAVEPERVYGFGAMLGGYCSIEQYEKWVAEETESPPMSPELKK